MPPDLAASARLLSLATAVPPHLMLQEDVLRHASRVFSPHFGGRDLSPLFANTGIVKRHSAMPIDWYLMERGWTERNEAYLAAAGDLFVEAAEKAIAAAGLRPVDIDIVVTVSSTGIATPSLEARVAGRMGFRPDISRVPVFGLGCAGGVSGLAIAARFAEARPGANVLLVSVELCTLSVRLDKADKANLVAVALFADGAAACVLRAGDGKEGLARIDGTGERLWPGTLDIMGWSIDAMGLGVIFDRSIPAFARDRIDGAVGAILGGMEIKRSQIERFVWHPGGAKVVTAIEEALELGQGALNAERAVLADYGNMSAPTVFFVLDHVLRQGPVGRMMLGALGPGFTASCAVLTGNV